MMQQEKQCIIQLEKMLKEKIRDQNSIQKLARQALRGAKGGLEIEDSFENWINRFQYQFVWLDKNDYLRALIRALWLAPVFAGIDFGPLRQRDMAQVWTDTARGFMGEIALLKFFRNRFGTEIEADTRRGDTKKFISTDIAKIRLPRQEWRRANINISIKTTKFYGRWLDVSASQFDYSDVFILIKIGILRQHFLAFLKAVSFLRDKLFVTAKNLGELDDDNAKKLWDEIPEFEPIPTYIAGFISKADINLPIHMVMAKIKGRKEKYIALTQGIGLFSANNVRDHKKINEIDPKGNLTIKIEPFDESLNKMRFLAHSGGLKYGEESWRQLIEKL